MASDFVKALPSTFVNFWICICKYTIAYIFASHKLEHLSQLQLNANMRGIEKVLCLVILDKIFYCLYISKNTYFAYSCEQIVEVTSL